MNKIPQVSFDCSSDAHPCHAPVPALSGTPEPHLDTLDACPDCEPVVPPPGGVTVCSVEPAVPDILLLCGLDPVRIGSDWMDILVMLDGETFRGDAH